MKNKRLKIPVIIFAVGLIAIIAAYLLTSAVKAPAITEHDFSFSTTYKLNGEIKTLDGIYRSQFVSTGRGTDPLERHYTGSYPLNPSEEHSAAYTIDEKDGLELRIVTSFSNRYLMGDTEGVPESTFMHDPYIAVYDSDEIEYCDEETLGKFDAELISWESPEPIENSLVFVGFSHLHDESMFAMTAVALLVIVACLIFVKRDKTVAYKGLDKLSIVLNFVITFLAIPFFVLIASLSQIFMGGYELSYQLQLCIPTITALTVAASVALRRNGFTKSGFFIQLIGPILFALLLILE